MTGYAFTNMVISIILLIGMIFVYFKYFYKKSSK